MESKPADGEDASPLAAVASSFPLLVYHYDDPSDAYQTMLSVADGSMHTFQVPEMSRYKCLETPQGLVLMVDTASLECSLWNPQTGEKTALPAMDEKPPQHCRCLISDTSSSPPDWLSDGETPPDSLVLVYDLEHPQLLFCRIRGGAAAAWARKSYDMGPYEIPGQPSTGMMRTINEMAAVEGVFYYLESRDVVGSLHSFTDDPEPCLELVTFDAVLPSLGEKLELSLTLTYLLESSKELFLVCLCYAVVDGTIELEEVGAYAMDFSREEWCKVTDIGDAAFLLGPAGFAASCSAADHGLKKGCVYFANDLVGNSNDFHIFDLKLGTRETIGPDQDIPVLSRKPFWLVPVVQ